MQARFLLGPAGSGKTFRCLAEIRAALRQSPEGPPLILLSPKQATFQLERQLLADDSVSGYSRLKILSFERLAAFVLNELGDRPPKALSDEGRVMVLRALSSRHADELALFRASARRPGFALELARLFHELQQHQVTSAKLRACARVGALQQQLRDKLNDLALLLDAYKGWLKKHGLEDGNHLLQAAAEALNQTSQTGGGRRIQQLWLDGFAEMTPQELDLLAAVVSRSEKATLAFCLDELDVRQSDQPWLSIWSVVNRSFKQCRERLKAAPNCEIQIETLERDRSKGRFTESPALQTLEQQWQLQTASSPPAAIAENSAAPSGVRVVCCADAEAEAILAAREILRFVRGGCRFRDCAVLVRNLDSHHKFLQRAFSRRQIPFFLDRRESVAHHPLAELTRGALRTIAFDWAHDDWFAALKSGFSPVPETDIDRLENKALEFGWRGKKWREPLPDEMSERLRQVVLPPFAALAGSLAAVGFRPDGGRLATVLRELWRGLRVEQTLNQWASGAGELPENDRQAAVHATVWTQMNGWLDNLELAFAGESLPLRDWLPIVEAGLGSLTVGVIPPALDQVLIGAIDRARNPDLKLALVLGVNETVFPATPAAPPILTDSDRGALPIFIGPDLKDKLAREQYYGYIACTRSRQQLIVTCARRNAEGKALNPSSFIGRLAHIFPRLEQDHFDSSGWREDIEHVSEAAPLLAAVLPATIHDERIQGLRASPTLAKLVQDLGALREPDPNEQLSETAARALYGPVLRSSVSRLEEFAQCPFRFFIRSGLRAEERKVFELDARERGTFQHEALKAFHEQLRAEKRRWRDVTPAEARVRLKAAADSLAGNYRGGLLRDSAQTEFEARALTAALQDFVEVMVGWMRSQYQFDPVVAELDFGMENARMPAWEMELAGRRKLALQGRIDRVDLWRDPRGASALAVVMDYKSSGKKLDALLVENGVQLQLLAYLGALRHWNKPGEILGVPAIQAAGAFYVNLRGKFESGPTRDDVLADDRAKTAAYRHNGRFDAGALDQLDSKRTADQFNYRLKRNGELYANSTEALPRPEFEKLLDGVEGRIRELGNRIFAGDAKVDPYRKNSQTPCEYCDYQSACRIDKWTHSYRVLRASG